MLKTDTTSLLIDAREFVPGKLTGIGRVLKGLTDAVAESDLIKEIVLAVDCPAVVPSELKNRKKIKIKNIPAAFLKSEKALSDLSKQVATTFISPYPKLPLFGCHCVAVHIIHDILDLTHPAYRKRYKVFLDTFRLKKALKNADLTWYDSSWSLKETRKYVDLTGANPRVRYPGIDESFNTERKNNEDSVLKKYELRPGYILVIGNGLPHKNLGVLLEISDQIPKQMVFVGVSEKNQAYWKSRYPKVAGVWIEHVLEEDLPPIIRGALCLAQPSTAEGYGYPPLEAMGCGVPAVVSNIPVLVETTGGNAINADLNNPKSWVEIFEALENKDIYQTQIEKGLKWVEPLRGRKGWERHISDIEELLTGEDRRQ